MSSIIKELPMKTDIKIALLEQSIINISEALKEIKFDLKAMRKDLEIGFDSVNKKADTNFQAINVRLWNNFLWLVGFGIALYGSLFAVIAHAMRWF